MTVRPGPISSLVGKAPAAINQVPPPENAAAGLALQPVRVAYAQPPAAVPGTPRPTLASPPPVNAAAPVAVATTGVSAPGAPPAWLLRDVQRVPPTPWLPQHVRMLPGETPTQALDRAAGHVLSELPPDVAANIALMHIPSWLVALTSLERMKPEDRDDVIHQLRVMTSLNGPPPSSAIAARAEQLLIFMGAARTPTPGSNATGKDLGSQGCTVALCKYLLAELKSEFPTELAPLNDKILTCEDHNLMLQLLSVPQLHDVISVSTMPFRQAVYTDFVPGSISMLTKPGGTHMLAWSRAPTAWAAGGGEYAPWTANARIGIGNTGLPEFGHRMSLAQEYVSSLNEPSHNKHGQLTDMRVIQDSKRILLETPHTNPYAAQELMHPGKVSFTFVRFLR